MPVGEFPKLLEINLVGQDTQRLVSRLLITQAAQQPSNLVNHINPTTA